MPSSFFGLDIAVSGMLAAQAGITTTGHNISNENTKGYSRQSVVQTAGKPMQVYTQYGMVGTGVQITGIERVREKYYDIKYWNNEAKLQENASKYKYTIQIEDCFNETDADGFSAQYRKIFDTLKSLEGNPSDLTYRTEFLQYCQATAEYLNEAQTNLQKLQRECNTQVSNDVDKINNLSRQIASVTKQINAVELTGAAANDLRDKRDVMLDELSGIVPVTITEEPTSNGKTSYQVCVGGYPIVTDYDYHELKLLARETKLNDFDAEGLYEVYYYYDEVTGSKTKLDVQTMNLSGSLRANLDVRDGNNGEDVGQETVVKYKGIAHYQNQLEVFKKTLADSFNELHQNAKIKDEEGNEVPANYNLYGNTAEDLPIFKISGDGKLTVNQELLDDPSLLAFSERPIQNGEGDGGLATRFKELEGKKIYKNATATGFLETILSEISVDVKKASTFETNYTNIKNSISNQRLSVSGVDSDEEAMNLTKYQEAFELAAKMISVMSQLYNKLINETGV